MEPGFSDGGTWNAAGGDWEAGVSEAEGEVETEAIEDGSKGGSVVDGAVAGGGGVASAVTVLVGSGSGSGQIVAAGTVGVGVADVTGVAGSTAGSGPTD